MCDVHLRSLPKPEEQPWNNWHTTQYDNCGPNTNCQAGRETETREKADNLETDSSSVNTKCVTAKNVKCLSASRDVTFTLSFELGNDMLSTLLLVENKEH